MEKLATVLGVVTFFFSIIYGVFWLDRVSCYTIWADFNPRYQLVGGCMIENNGRYIPAKNFRGLVE